jgi:putative effector of murein hydrolase LrgA (UPF0299 family)
LRAQGLPVVIALLVSTFLGMGTAALVVQAMNRRARMPQARQPVIVRRERAGGADV